MKTLFKARRQNAGHTLMPFRMIQRQTARKRITTAIKHFEQEKPCRRDALHYFFARRVKLNQPAGQNWRVAKVISEKKRHHTGPIHQTTRGN